MIEEIARLLAAKASLDYSSFGIWLQIAVRLAIIAAFFVPLISAIAILAIWGERKIAGHIQGRLGPTHVGPYGLLWIAAGGLCYTIGIAFYAARHVPFMHAVWHLFVLAGSIIHFLGVLFCVVLAACRT